MVVENVVVLAKEISVPKIKNNLNYNQISVIFCQNINQKKDHHKWIIVPHCSISDCRDFANDVCYFCGKKAKNIAEYRLN